MIGDCAGPVGSGGPCAPCSRWRPRRGRGGSWGQPGCGRGSAALRAAWASASLDDTGWSRTCSSMARSGTPAGWRARATSHVPRSCAARGGRLRGRHSPGSRLHCVRVRWGRWCSGPADAIAEGKIAVMLSTDRQRGTLLAWPLPMPSCRRRVRATRHLPHGDRLVTILRQQFDT